MTPDPANPRERWLSWLGTLGDVARLRVLRLLEREELGVGELSRALADSGALIFELAPSAATLEDLFFELTEGEGEAEAEEQRLDEAADLTGGPQ